MAAMRLGCAETWHQLFTDGTSCQQQEFQNLVISVQEDEEECILDPVIVSLCIYLENGTSEMQVKAIVEQVRKTTCDIVNEELACLTFMNVRSKN